MVDTDLYHDFMEAFENLSTYGLEFLIKAPSIEKLLIERTRRATLCPYQVEIRPINIAIIKEFLPKCRFISINAFLQECRVPSSSARVYFKVRSNGCAVK